jgi:outer membrane autotransporter protein
MPFYNIEASPMATLQYTFLNTNAYTETSAIGLNLTQNSTRASNLQLGLGGKISEVSQSDEFLPEIHAFYLVDLRPTSVQTTAQFTNGGGTFVVQAPIAPRSGVNLGGSLSAKLSEFSLIILGYDLQLKKGFIDHSASFKFRWLF